MGLRCPIFRQELYPPLKVKNPSLPSQEGTCFLSSSRKVMFRSSRFTRSWRTTFSWVRAREDTSVPHNLISIFLSWVELKKSPCERVTAADCGGRQGQSKPSDEKRGPTPTPLRRRRIEEIVAALYERRPCRYFHPNFRWRGIAKVPL